MGANNLNLETLEIIDTIDRRGSFASAAEELGKVPSALSYAVGKLEERLQVTLFSRQGRKSVLTPAGKMLLVEGRKLLEASRHLEMEARRIATGWETRIRIAVDAIQDLTPLMKVIKQFTDEHPSIEIHLNEEVMGGTWEALVRDRVDLVFGAAAPAPQSQGIRAEPHKRNQRVVIAIAATHPLAHFWGKVSRRELAKYRQVIIHDSSIIDVPRSSEMYSEHRRFYVSNMAQKIQAQRQGIGFGFVPYEAIKGYLASGEMKVLEVEGAASTHTSLVAWKVANQGKGLKRLRELLLSPEPAEPQASFF